MQKVINIFNSLSFSGKASVYSLPYHPAHPYDIFFFFSSINFYIIFIITITFLFVCLKSFGVVPVFVTLCWHLLQMSTWWPNRSHTRSVANVPMWPRQAGTGECLLAPLCFIISSLVHLFFIYLYQRGRSAILHAAFPFSTRTKMEEKKWILEGWKFGSVEVNDRFPRRL